MAADYPTEFAVGDSNPEAVGVGNREHRTAQYMVVMLLQAVRFGDNETVVDQEAELDRFIAELSYNQTWQRSYDMAPTFTG